MWLSVPPSFPMESLVFILRSRWIFTVRLSLATWHWRSSLWSLLPFPSILSIVLIVKYLFHIKYWTKVKSQMIHLPLILQRSKIIFAWSLMISWTGFSQMSLWLAIPWKSSSMTARTSSWPRSAPHTAFRRISKQNPACSHQEALGWGYYCTRVNVPTEWCLPTFFC